MLIELPATLAQKLSDTAAAEGLDASAYVRRLVEGALQTNNFAVSAPFPSPQEVSQLSNDELLRRINGGPSESFWGRYRELARKRDATIITQNELAELIQHSDIMEAWGAERLSYVVELSKRRGTTLPELIDLLGLRPALMA